MWFPPQFRLMILNGLFWILQVPEKKSQNPQRTGRAPHLSGGSTFMFVGGVEAASSPAQEFDLALSSLLGSMDKRVWVGIRLCPHQSDLVTSAIDVQQMILLV